MGKKIKSMALIFFFVLSLNSTAQQWIYTGLPITGAIRSVEFLDFNPVVGVITNNKRKQTIFSPRCWCYHQQQIK